MSDRPKARILVADDDLHTRNLVCEVCESLGHTTQFAEDGEQALARAIETTPDLMLLDVMMPRLDGFEILRRLRAAPGTSDVAVIILTAIGDIDGKLRGIELGADDYVTKPFRVADLQRRIDLVLDKRRYRRELRSAQGRPQDALRGAGAYHELKAHLERSVAEARAAGKPLAALFLSVDDLAVASAGLEPRASGGLLREVAERIERALREPDRVFRIDLETFVVLMPDTTCEAANRVAERLLRAVRQAPTAPSADLSALTISAGIAGFPRYGADRSFDLIHAASLALANARHSGAGAICIA
ncbi:MAG: response regulator [Myxococcales bacterium]|jgi:diguanylate cyclase (GGDEF)-like protein